MITKLLFILTVLVSFASLPVVYAESVPALITTDTGPPLIVVPENLETLGYHNQFYHNQLTFVSTLRAKSTDDTLFVGNTGHLPWWAVGYCLGPVPDNSDSEYPYLVAQVSASTFDVVLTKIYDRHSNPRKYYGQCFVYPQVAGLAPKAVWGVWPEDSDIGSIWSPLTSPTVIFTEYTDPQAPPPAPPAAPGGGGSAGGELNISCNHPTAKQQLLMSYRHCIAAAYNWQDGSSCLEGGNGQFFITFGQYAENLHQQSCIQTNGAKNLQVCRNGGTILAFSPQCPR